jgi:hypothetical protein
VLWNPASGGIQLDAVRNAASTLSVTLEVFAVSRASDFERTFQAVAAAQVGGVLMLPAPLFGGNPQLLADLTLQGRLPAINIFPDFARKGGLLAYGPELQSLFMQAGAQGSARRSASRIAGGASGSLQIGGEPQDSTCTQFDAANLCSAKRRRGHRIKGATSSIGTFETCRPC